ncbi:MAG: CRISPR-associated protein Cas4 [Bacteroidota bacterium]|nr:CRISPR-associated protein Cas4 [Bacteroidota bacterium]MDE2646028.1 CRISPR-associated protein Cas4 [Bacteroidota bacterium]
MSIDPVILISAIEHFVYCPRQCALIYCDGMWSDNAHTVRGKRAHRRVDSGQYRKERGRQVLRSLPLWSETMGLSGRADAVEISNGVICPIEYKSGTRHGTSADLQLCAQALCLEEMFAVEISYGYIWYTGPRRRIKVDFTPKLRDEVKDIVMEIRSQILTAELPGAPNDERCKQCQFLQHCLPELTSSPHKVKKYMAGFVFACDI